MLQIIRENWLKWLLGGIASTIITSALKPILAATGWLDGPATAIGLYLKVHVSADLLAWTIALIVGVVLYSFILIKFPNRSVATGASVHALPEPVSDPAEELERRYQEALGQRRIEDRLDRKSPMTVLGALVGWALEPQRDTALPDALAYAELRVWGKSFFEAVSTTGNQADQQLVRFRQLAHDGELTVWGKRTESGVFEKIPKVYWVDHNVEWFDLLRGKARTESTKNKLGDPFFELMVSRFQIETAWPPLPVPEPHAKELAAPKVALVVKADTPVAEAIVFLELGYWKGFIADLYDREPQRRKVAYRRFEHMAKRDEISVWGCLAGKAIEKPIPPAAWNTFELDEVEMEDNVARAVPRQGKTSKLFFTDLMVSQKQLSELRD